MPVPVFYAQNLKNLPHVSHGFFTRQGGISTGDFSSLNCKQNGDTPENVIENRKRIVHTLIGQEWVNVTQEHTSHVLHIKDTLPSPPPVADAMVTTTKGLCLSILTADCVPILLADKNLPIIGSLHAGWRGMCEGIIQNTIDKMKTLGATDIISAIGPCIHQQSYEVSHDFKDSFKKSNLMPFFSFASYAAPLSNAKYLFNLPLLAQDILKSHNIHDIEQIPYNTYEHEDLFFSYRRKTHKHEAAFGCHVSSITLS